MADWKSELAEMLIPWHLQPSALNVGEEEEIRRRRGLPPTLTKPGGVVDVGVLQPEKKGSAVSAIKLTTKVVERLGPYLRRVQSASSVHWTKFLDAMKAKGFKGTTVDDVIKYVRENPLNAAVVFATLADVGLTVGDLFTSEDKADPEVRRSALRLEQSAMGVGEMAQANIARVAAASEALSLGVADSEVQLRTLQEICRWARGFFGGDRAALEAHQKLQAFSELSYADIEAGFRYLR